MRRKCLKALWYNRLTREFVDETVSTPFQLFLLRASLMLAGIMLWKHPACFASKSLPFLCKKCEGLLLALPEARPSRWLILQSVTVSHHKIESSKKEIKLATYPRLLMYFCITGRLRPSSGVGPFRGTNPQKRNTNSPED